jgi:hypothetical protein
VRVSTAEHKSGFATATNENEQLLQTQSLSCCPAGIPYFLFTLLRNVLVDMFLSPPQ